MILKAAQDKTAFTQQLLFTSAARKAWMHLLKQVNGTKQGKVLLPAYIGFTEREGSGVFDPIEDTNSQFEFYPVNEQLGFDIADVESALAKGDIKVVLVIHYFGFCQADLSAIVALCKKYNAFLVEDCAHAFQLGLQQQKLGIAGDYVFYSLHKYLATETGGLLKVNNTGIDMPAVPEEYRISPQVLEQYIKTDLEALAEKRKSNYRLYASMLSDVAGIDVMYELTEDVVPHNFPIKVREGKREALYFHLINQGMPVIALYYRLIDQIKKEAFPVSFKVASEILNFPVHQDTNEVDIQQLSKAVIEFFKKDQQ